MDDVEFLRPCEEMAVEITAFKDAFFAQGETFINGSCRLECMEDFGEWLAYCRKAQRGTWVARPSDTFFARRRGEQTLIGVVNIRNTRGSEQLLYGNVGYSVLPGERGKGYGVALLRFGIQHAHEMGARRIYTCCYDTNLASRRVMEKCGMRPEAYYIQRGTGKRVLRYLFYERDNVQI